MKLYYTATSPYARKVLIVLHELGLSEQVSLEFLRPSPMSADPVLSSVNPLNKIPTLVTEAGALYDSPVICEYLCSLVETQTLLPKSGAARWQTLRLQALADGIMDSAILVFYERMQRPKELHWAPWIDGQTQKALQGLDALEQEITQFEGTCELGQISAAAGLGWMLFRDVLGDIRTTRPRLFHWYDQFAQRPSMVRTVPSA
ncbi:MAG: glutathione S-transferase N-terminal domain-containing protein [Deltaproteobacteria bacterium]|nr:glutathione S-transferase N-terminal domain-containing protein [Deltaproteobacteria bacterium]